MELSSPGGESTRDTLLPLLLAAFIIVVTALLATVVLDMGQPPEGGDVASASVEFDPDGDEVRVAFTSMSRPGTTLVVSVQYATDDETVATATLSAVGRDHTFDHLEDGQQYRVVVVADWNDGRSIVTARTDRL